MSGWCDHVNTGIPIHGKVSKRISRRMGGRVQVELLREVHCIPFIWNSLGTGNSASRSLFSQVPPPLFLLILKVFPSPFPIFQLFPPLHIHTDMESVGEPQENQRIPRKSQIPPSSWKLSRTAPAGDDFPITTPHINTQAVRQEAFP